MTRSVTFFLLLLKEKEKENEEIHRHSKNLGNIFEQQSIEIIILSSLLVFLMALYLYKVLLHRSLTHEYMMFLLSVIS